MSSVSCALISSWSYLPSTCQRCVAARETGGTVPEPPFGSLPLSFCRDLARNFENACRLKIRFRIGLIFASSDLFREPGLSELDEVAVLFIIKRIALPSVMSVLIDRVAHEAYFTGEDIRRSGQESILIPFRAPLFIPCLAHVTHQRVAGYWRTPPALSAWTAHTVRQNSPLPELPRRRGTSSRSFPSGFRR